MGGKIGLQSSPGQGSRFWFSLDFGLQGAAPLLSAPQPVHFGDTRVLLILDPDKDHANLRATVSGWVDDAESVANGARAFARLIAAAQAGRGYHVILVANNSLAMDAISA